MPWSSDQVDELISLSSPTCVNSGETDGGLPARFPIWKVKTSRASSGPRQDGVCFHQRWPLEMARHSAPGAKSEANDAGSP